VNLPDAFAANRLEINSTSGGGSSSTALVVFADETSLYWLRMLRCGFRHCFIAVSAADGWIIMDPMSHQTELAHIAGWRMSDLARWYRSHGLRVVEARVQSAPRRPAPLAPMTCVEAVKRVLGVQSRWVVTPWQLYRLLTRAADCCGASHATVDSVHT
jgi:hypothetical protein